MMLDKEKAKEAEKDRTSSQQAPAFTFLTINNHETMLCAEDLSILLFKAKDILDGFQQNKNSDIGIWWLDMFNASEEDIRQISAAFRLHPLVSEDIITLERREKLERFGSHYLLCLRTFSHAPTSRNPSALSETSLYAVVFPNGVLTVSPHDDWLVREARSRLRRSEVRDTFQMTSDWICYILIDSIVDCIQPHVKSLEYEIEALEDSVMTLRFSDAEPILTQIHFCHKRINLLRSLVVDKVSIITALTKQQTTILGGFDDISFCSSSQYLRDVQDHVLTALSSLDYIKDVLEKSHSLYLSRIKSQQYERVRVRNKLLRRLNCLLGVFMLLNIFPQLFTMYVPIPGLHAKGLGWFFGIAASMTAVGICCVLTLKRWRVF